MKHTIKSLFTPAVFKQISSFFAVMALLLTLAGNFFAVPQQALAQATTYTQISAGYYHTCGILSSNSNVSCDWEGRSQYNQASPASGTFTQISSGGLHTCGVKSNGSLACWGAGTSNTGVNPHFGQANPPGGTAYVQVSAGDLSTCAVDSSGAITCWGYDTSGNTTPASGTYTQVSSGIIHTCGLKTNGTLACWGANNVSQTTNVPSGTFTKVSSGGYHNCAIKSDGTLACWGNNDYTQTDNVPSGTYTDVSAGGYHTCAVKSDGTLACWGLGITNTGIDQKYGQAIPPSGNTYTKVSASANKSCALKSDSTMVCWGMRIISGNAGIAGVQLGYTDGSAKSATANSSGDYWLPVTYNWSGTVTPSLTGYMFSPTSRSYSSLVTNPLAQDYTPTQLYTSAFTSNASEDGWVLESSAGSGVGGWLFSTGNAFILGDDASNRHYRAILSFDTASLPANATVQSAVLKIKYSSQDDGVNPFTDDDFGDVQVDIKQGTFGTSALELGDFNAATSNSISIPVGHFDGTSVSNWHSATLNSTARFYINLSGLTQFRLGFHNLTNNTFTNGDSTADTIRFIAGDYGTNPPELVITYTTP